ncbi:unnamed protein product [Closterium sp. NIES-64]|nr:unnamed protein product [Closterium sp. NIES-64]CAI5999355.1 unnamed protein product [Closterium sp. NIES-64]
MKMKGLKRERKEVVATRKKAKQDAPTKGGERRGQEVGSMSLMKMKGLKREHMEATATREKAKQDTLVKWGEGRGGKGADGGASGAQE